jgi:hypothetical protein
MQPKGKIHVAFGKPIGEDLSEIDKAPNENEKIKLLANYIDKQIYHNYKLNPVNYIAYDLLNENAVFENSYTSKEKADFIAYIDSKIGALNGEPEVLKQLFITLYANPVINKLK